MVMMSSTSVEDTKITEMSSVHSTHLVSPVDVKSSEYNNDNDNDLDYDSSENKSQQQQEQMKNSSEGGDSGSNDGGLYTFNCHSLTTGPAAHVQTTLAEDFVLGDDDVICGRGSRCFNHIGNQRFRDTVEQFLPRYTGTQCKHEKTSIICEVVKLIRQRSPNGGFVKFDKGNGLHYEVGDFLAREKVSQAFRDASEAYKSSNATKKKKRLVDSNRRTMLRKSQSCESLFITNPAVNESGDTSRVALPTRRVLSRAGSKRSFDRDSNRQESFKFTRGELGQKHDSCHSFDYNHNEYVNENEIETTNMINTPFDTVNNVAVFNDFIHGQHHNQQYDGDKSLVFGEEPLEGEYKSTNRRPHVPKNCMKKVDLWSSCPDLNTSKITTMNFGASSNIPQQNEQFNINPNTHAELDPILLQDDSLFGENGMCFGMSSSNYNNNSNNNHQARSLLSRITPQQQQPSSQACGKPNALLALMEQRNQQRMNPTNVVSSSSSLSPTKLSISQQIQQQMQQQQHGTTITEPMDDTLNDDLLFERLLEFTETSTTPSATNHNADPYQPISMNLEPSPLWYE